MHIHLVLVTIYLPKTLYPHSYSGEQAGPEGLLKTMALRLTGLKKSPTQYIQIFR